MIGQEIKEKLDTLVNDEPQQAVPANCTRASELGWIEDCPRYLCLRRLCPGKESKKSPDFRRRLREGKKQETLIRADLKDAGFNIAPRARLTWKDLHLTGEIDNDLLINTGEYPIDYKTCSSAMFKQVLKAQSPYDLRQSRFYWIRHYPAQLSAYELMLQRDLGVLLFKDKESGEYHLIDVPLDMEYASLLIDGLREINRLVEKEDPPAVDYKEICDSCGFFDYDFPDTDKATMRQSGIEIVTDESWLLKLAEWQELVDAGAQDLHKKFAKLDKEIKDAFLGRHVIVGSHMIESKPYLTTTYDIPKDVKDKYKGKTERYRTEIKFLAKAL